MGIDESRRRFLKTVGAAAFTFGAVAAGCKDKGLSDKKPFKPVPNDKLSYDSVVNTHCGICMIRCGMKAYIKDGQAVFIEGNPADPYNRGKLCPKGKAALGFEYNPDRLLYPLKRTNTAAKDFGVDPQWQQITWEEAYTTIIDEMTKATESSPGAADFANGEAFAFFSHGEYGWCKRVLEAIGSPNLVSHYDACFTPSFIARKMLVGGNPWTNLAGADYILSFGWDQPDRSKNYPTGQFADVVASGATITCFNPFQGTVGAKATSWIPIKPGTDLAVMLALIDYILNTPALFNLINTADKLGRTNFATYSAQILAHFDGSTYTPAWAEGISGVPASTITQIATEFVNAQKAIAPIHKRDGAAGPNYRNSFYCAHAVVILNTLVGAVDRDGGEATLAWGWKPSAPLSYKETPPMGFKDLIKTKYAIDGKHRFPLVRDKITDRGIFANVAERILSGGDHGYTLKMAMFRRYGILSFPNPAKIADALKTLDYVVFCDSMPKQVMWFADMVLPEQTFLEGTGIGYMKFCSPGYKMVWGKTKIHSPLGEAKGWGSVLKEIGKRLDILRGTQYFVIDGGTYDGQYVTGSIEKAAMANNIQAGLTLSDITSATDGLYIKEQAPYTASKSGFDIYSEAIEALNNGEFLDAAHVNFGMHYEPLPIWLEKAAKPDPATYPFYMIIRRWAGLKHSAPLTCDNPYSLDAFPGPVALIHPTNAAALGIDNGDMVWVESANGKMKSEARISERIRPDCVLVNHNYGHTVNELTYKFEYGGDGALIVDRSEADAQAVSDWSAAAWISDVCVKVYKA